MLSGSEMPMLPVNIDNMISHTSRLILAASVVAALCSGCNSQPSPASSSYRDQPNRAAETEQVDFVTEILPIFERSCFPCHGPKMSPVSMAGFRVDLREHAVGRQKIVPGAPDESPLIKRLITAEDAERMPPLKSDNPQPSNEQLELIKRWIKEGASYGAQEDKPGPDDAPVAIDLQRSGIHFSVVSTEKHREARIRKAGTRSRRSHCFMWSINRGGPVMPRGVRKEVNCLKSA